MALVKTHLEFKDRLKRNPSILIPWVVPGLKECSIVKDDTQS